MDLPSSASICQCCSGVVPNLLFSGVSAILFSSYFSYRVVIVMWCWRPCELFLLSRRDRHVVLAPLFHLR